MPFNKSLNCIAMMVTINGINCSHPNLYISLNKEILASLYPTINNTAAKQASGILFKMDAKNATLNNNNIP